MLKRMRKVGLCLVGILVAPHRVVSAGCDTTPPDKGTYTQEKYDRAYAFAAGHPDGLAIMLLMETGITRSELLGHGDLKTLTKIYDHTDTNTLRQAMAGT